MYYLLRHISQLHLSIVIALLIGATGMWIPSLLMPNMLGQVVLTFALTAINTFMAMYLCQRMNISKMLDLFAGFLYFFSFSIIPWTHSIWQIQLMALLLQWVIVVLSSIQPYQLENATEEAFLSAFLMAIACCFVPTFVFLYIGIFAFLLFRHQLSFRTIMAMIIACAVVALWFFVFVFAGWLSYAEWTWMQMLYLWVTPCLLFLSFSLAGIFYSGNTLWRGITFLCYLAIGCIAYWLCLWVIPNPLI